MSRRIFVSTFFHRLFEMESEIDSIQLMIATHIGKPSGLAEIRRRVMVACKQASLLDALLTQVKTSSHSLPDISEEDARTHANDPSFEILLETLETKDYREELVVRLKDLESLLKCARLGLDSLRENTDVISEVQMFKLQESLQSNTRNLESLFRANESSANSLQLMQLIIGGSLAFSVMYRLVGNWNLLDASWGRDVFDAFIDPPALWLIISLLFFALIVLTLQYALKRMLEKASADINLRYSLHVKISILALRRFLKRHELYGEEADTDVEGNNVYKATWEEPAEAYEGASVRVEITVDQGHARLSTLTLKYNRRSGTLSVQEVQERFFGELVVAGVILDASGARSSVQNVFHPPLARFQHTILYDRVGPFLSTDR